MNKSKIIPTLTAIGIIVIGIFLSARSVMAEQSGSSPESGSTSKIKTIYDDLSTLNFGTDTDTPDWGTYWNRIKTAANWTAVLGDATEADVANGKNFYAGDNRTLKTGNAPAATPNLMPKTGQVTEYQAGDDGTYQAGIANTFTDLGDGTVKDSATNLIWPIDWSGAGANDSSAFANWNAAVDYCQNGTFFGNSDWRLPNRFELESTLDLSRNVPPTNVIFTNVYFYGYFWSSTSYAGVLTKAWFVNMNNGSINFSDKIEDYYNGVCVRQ